MDEKEVAKRKFNKFITKAKEKIASQEYPDALKYFKKAEAIFSTEKLISKIEKLTRFLKECDEDSDDENDDDYETVNGLKIHKGCWEKLYPYQREGVLWFWDIYQLKTGGILGDDMGLGKTIQVIAFLSGMFDQSHIKSVLIVVPKSLMENWSNEFEKWAPGIRIAEFHGAKGKREKELDKIQRKSGVILTTYGMVSTSHEQFSEHQSRRFIWDYIILDEGHKIKNPNKTSKCVRSIPAKNHIILTGTPVQNNLSELWSLVDFVTEGKLLGSRKTFKTEFENPIVRAREKDASSYEKRMGNEISNTLRKMIDQYFLRRTKAAVFGNNKNDKENHGEMDRDEISSVDGTQSSESKLDLQLSKKNDFIIWLYLSEIQLQIYKDFLETAGVREALASTKSPLAQLTMLKKIADHPRLLSSAVCETLGLCDDTHAQENLLVQESSKLQFLIKLMKNIKEENHRVLIFSQSRKMLDIVDKVLTKEGMKLLRFDGRILDPSERQSLINQFQTDPSITCFLLTTQVGSVGLNLTGADRVVIFDPSWNPGNDAQAVDRAYRIGQNKDVIIYRLITCGTIEEKIYRKQIFKDSISKQTTGSSKNPLRYFARNQLRELFILENPRSAETHGILQELNGESKHEPDVEVHLDFLKSLDIFGVSDHGLVFSKEARAEADAIYDNQIMERVKRAKDIVMSEVCDQISNISLNEKDIFQPSREDIRRYMPNINKNEKPTEKTEIEVNRFVVPDSPTSPMSKKPDSSDIYHSTTDSIERTSQYFRPESENIPVLTIEDSLSSTPGDVQNETGNIKSKALDVQDDGRGAKIEHSTVQDSYNETESPAFVQSEGEDVQDMKNSPNKTTPNDESYVVSDSPVFAQSEQKDAQSEQRDAESDQGDVQSEHEATQSETADGSYIQMTEPFGEIDLNIITSPVFAARPRTLVFSETNERNSTAGSLSELPIETNKKPENLQQYRESYSDDTMSDIANRSGQSERSNQASFYSDHPTDCANEASYAEVIDTACSPISDFSAVQTPATCVTQQDRESSSVTLSSRRYPREELQSFRDLEKSLQNSLNLREDAQGESSICENLRRSAVGLIYGITDDIDGVKNNESAVSIDVIDAACSPLSIKEDASDEVKETKARHSHRLSSNQHLQQSIASDHQTTVNSDHIPILKSVRRHSSRRPDSLEAPVVSCSTPQHGQIVAVTKHMAVYERRASFQEALQKEKYDTPGGLLSKSRESSRRSGGVSSRSGGLDPYAGSESLFSNSVLSEEAKYNDNKANSKLAISNGEGSESLFSDHMLTDSKQSSQNGSRLDADQRFEPIREESENRTKFYRSFDLDVQEDMTLLLDHAVRIKNQYISESDSDLQSNKSDQAMISDDPVPMINNQSNHSDHQSNYFPPIVESDDDVSEIAIKVGNTLNHQAISDQSENHDYASDADSLSSNELNMISVLSGNRRSSANHRTSVAELINSDPDDSDQTDQSDSDDELLMRSRKSLRRSIMTIPRRSETDPNMSAEGDHCLEENGFSHENEFSSGVSDKCTCEKHGSAHFTVHKCPCMLSADELSEYNRHVEMAIDHMQNGDNLEALLAYIKALEIADYDLEMRQKVCSLVLE